MANPLPPGQRQIYDHFDDETESSYEEAGDPRGMFTGPIFAAICVIVGVATITAALYLFLSEVSKTRLAESASKSRLGKSLSESLSGSLDYVKKKIDSVGSSEDLANLAEETTRAVPARGETKDDDALEQPVVITG